MKNRKSAPHRFAGRSLAETRFIRFLRHPLVLTSILLIATAAFPEILSNLASAQRLPISRLPVITRPFPQKGDEPEIGPEAAKQIEALMQEKDSRTPAQNKIDSQLLYKQKMLAGQPIAEGVTKLDTGVSIDNTGGTEVDIRANVDDELLVKLSELNAIIIDSAPQYRSIIVRMPLDQLETIAAMPQVIFIQPNFRANVWKNTNGVDARPLGNFWESNYTRLPFLDQKRALPFAERARRVRAFLDDQLTQSGSVTSQGDTTHQANLARSTIGPDGTGIKIGVLSDGVVSLAASQASGDLGPVTVLPGQTGSSTGAAGSGDEGTAMLEVIHDVAPGAQLYFATADPTISRFAQNVRDLRAAGCDIIIDDVFYFVESPFQDGQAPSVVSNTNGGLVTQAVKDVTAAGALYFSSAGNQGNQDDNTASCYQGDFLSGGTLAAVPGGNVHNFGGGAQSDLIQTGSGSAINLYWSDPLGGSTNDYDLFVMNNTLTTLVSSSTNVQNGTQDPEEQAAGNSTNNRIVVLQKTGAANRFLHITINANGLGKLGTSTNGTTKGHSIALNAFSVSATPASAPGPFPAAFNSANVSETFTSDGPRRIFFNENGSAITPGDFSSTGGVLRQKPDITAADRVSVTGAGGFPTTFSGTSAAAPHAGAIAALLKSGLPSPTNAQIRTALISSAIDIETPGVDRDTGAGIVMPLLAMANLGITAQAVIGKGGQTVTEFPGNSDGDGQVEKGETARLVISNLTNVGVAAATGVTATLSSTTPGVTVPTAGPFPYSNIASAGGVASNATPYIFFLGPAYTCGTPVDFVLTVNYTDPAVRSQQIRFTVDLAKTVSVPTTTVDATTPPANAAYTTSLGTQTSRVFRSGEGSSCNLTKAFPGTITGVSPRFDGYTFTATSTGCATVSITGASVNPVFAVAYLGAFVPASIATNYLGDIGLSPGNGQTLSFAFKVNVGQQFTVIVSEVGAATTPAYTLSVSGQPCSTCNFSPTAANVSVSGRVRSASGGSVSNAVVTLSDQSGGTHLARTNAFGYFRIDDVEAGRAYTATVTARRYTFAPQFFQLNDELTSLNFVASP